MLDEPEFKSVDAPKIEGDFVLFWDGETIVGDIDYIFNYIGSKDLHVHDCSQNGVMVNLEIHNFKTIWYEALSPVTSNQYKESE